MSRFAALLLGTVLVAGCAARLQAQQVENAYPHFQALLGLDVGYFAPAGDWTKHPYAPVDQFRGGLALGGDFELRPFDSLGLAAVGGVAWLDTSDWESYALLQGDDVDASVYVYHLAGVLRPYLMATPPDLLKLELGAGFFAGDGQESFGGEYYAYDFLTDQFLFVVGIQYDRFISSRACLAVRLPLLLSPDGVQYASGERHTVVGFPLTIGIRCAI